MPGPPVGGGHGREGGSGYRGWSSGWGGGAVGQRPKAAPIARPSTDYVWKLEQRVYCPEEKKRREEARRAEAERRDASRTAGENVDLGRAGAYWSKVAATNGKSAPFNRTYIPTGPPTTGPGGKGSAGRQLAIGEAPRSDAEAAASKAPPPKAPQPAAAARGDEDPWAMGDPWGGTAAMTRQTGSRQKDAGGEQQGQEHVNRQEDELGGHAPADAGADVAEASADPWRGQESSDAWAACSSASDDKWRRDDRWDQWEERGQGSVEATGSWRGRDAWAEAVPEDPWAIADPWGGTGKRRQEDQRTDTVADANAAGGDAWSWGRGDAASSTWSDHRWNSGSNAGVQSWDVAKSSAWGDRQWTPGVVPTTFERSFNKEEKERRAALRRAEAERRQQERPEPKADEVVAAAPASSSTPPSSTAAEPAEEPSPVCQPGAISLRLAGLGITDDDLASLTTTWRAALAAGEAVWPSRFVVDIRDNKITDKGLADFLAFLCEVGAQPEELLLIGNPLKEPHSLRDLLSHERSGLDKNGGKLWRVDISAGQFTCSCFWKFLETCAYMRPRPPLRLGLLRGELGELRLPLELAEKNHRFLVHRSGLQMGSPVPSETVRLGINADLELVCTMPYEPPEAKGLTSWQ